MLSNISCQIQLNFITSFQSINFSLHISFCPTSAPKSCRNHRVVKGWHASSWRMWCQICVMDPHTDPPTSSPQKHFKRKFHLHSVYGSKIGCWMHYCRRKTNDHNRTTIFPLSVRSTAEIHSCWSASYPERFTNSRFYSWHSGWLVFRFHLSSKVISPSESALRHLIFFL